jgi:branched-chain amino acid transport system substrate-binding protein
MYGDDPNPAVNDFVDKFKARTGAVPATDAALGGYSAGEMIFKAMQKTQSTDGAKLAAVLNSFQNEPLLMGPTTYTDQVHIVTGRPMKIIKYTNGKPSYDGTLEVPGKVDLHLGT